jgi:predicted esterase
MGQGFHWSARTTAAVCRACIIAGSDGYGAAFENSSDLDAQAAELNAAVTYLEASQGIKPHNIVVLAASYGTEILIEALKRNSALCGAIVFAPLLIGREALSNIEPLQYRGAVIAFHGARDPLCPPSVAVEYLRRLFARSFVHRSAVSWRVFGNDGHRFSGTASLQEMYATIECTVTGSCDGVMRGGR